MRFLSSWHLCEDGVTMSKIGDIDIDVADRNIILKKIKCVPASIIEKEKMLPHNTGVYVQHIPVDPYSELSSIDYRDAESQGFVKLDIINNNTYQGFTSNKQIEELLDKEPNWNKLLDKNFVSQLPHVAKHYDRLVQYKPTSIEEMAIFLAMIRPAKAYLLKCNDREKIAREVWVKDDNGYYFFKKSHAFAYAMSVVLKMNAIVYGISPDT